MAVLGLEAPEYRVHGRRHARRRTPGRSDDAGRRIADHADDVMEDPALDFRCIGILQRLDDPPVAAGGLLQRAHRRRLRHLETMAVEGAALEDRQQRGEIRHPEQPPVKFLVRLEQRVLVVARRGGFHLPHAVAQRIELLAVDARQRLACRARFEACPDVEAFLRFDGGDRRDDRPAVAVAHDETVFLEAQQRFAYRRLAAVHALGEFQFDQLLTRAQARQHDLLLEAAVDFGRPKPGSRAHREPDPIIDNRATIVIDNWRIRQGAAGGGLAPVRARAPGFHDPVPGPGAGRRAARPPGKRERARGRRR